MSKTGQGNDLSDGRGSSTCGCAPSDNLYNTIGVNESKLCRRLFVQVLLFLLPTSGAVALLRVAGHDTGLGICVDVTSAMSATLGVCLQEWIRLERSANHVASVSI